MKTTTRTHRQLAEYGRQGAYELLARDGAAEVGARLGRALAAHYERRADPDGLLSPEERRARAEWLRRAQLAQARAAKARLRTARQGRDTSAA